MAVAEWAATQGKPVLTEEQAKLVEQMAAGVLAHELARQLLAKGVAEAVVRASWHGVPCQIRMDYLSDMTGAALVDLKTADDLTWFEADARRYGYPHQLAFYRSVHGVHGEQEAAYQDLIKNDSTVRGQATERSNLERMKNDLIAKQRQRDVLIEKQAGLQRERNQLLEKLSELRDRRYAIRAAVAKRINDALLPTIRVSIVQSGHLGQYRTVLEDALRGGRIKQGVVAQRIVEGMNPDELGMLIRKGDVDAIVKKTGINTEQARKVVDTLKNAETLYELETVEMADRPHIELKDGDNYKDSTTLSTGQKCTTILPILLLDSDNPLLVDQPEDNLDNRFVCESVVESIRKVKSHRQLVFVTHNPNIPVLADAEQVIVLESNGAHSRKAGEGNVDACRNAIVNLLEGGEQAFKRRQERYAC